MNDIQTRWWWLSFAGEEGPRGVTIVSTSPDGDILEAVKAAYVLNANPGGEVRGYIYPSAAALPDPEYRERLLTPEEACACVGGMRVQ